MRQAFPSLPRIPQRSSSTDDVNRTGARHPGFTCSMGWPAGRPRLAGRWAGSWECLAIPSAPGSRATKWAAWRLCWRCTCLPANPCPAPQTCWLLVRTTAPRRWGVNGEDTLHDAFLEVSRRSNYESIPSEDAVTWVIGCVKPQAITRHKREHDWIRRQRASYHRF